jgi:hypothetical protein
MENDTTITLKCDLNGDFLLIGPGGPPWKMWFYPREDWAKAQKRMWSMVKPANGDPK